MIRLAILVPTLLSSSALVVYAQAAPPSAPAFVENFTGDPTMPTPYRPSGWDTTVLGGPGGAMIPMLADHGPDCSAPPLIPPAIPPRPAAGAVVVAPTPAVWQHLVSNVEEAVYQCHNHVMTALFNGYAAVYLTPPAEMDFSAGASTLTWNMSTHRTGSRDWIDVVIMPFAENQQVNFQDNHIPNDAVHVQLAGGGNVLIADVLRGSAVSPTWQGNCGDNPQPTTCHVHGDGFTTWDMVLAKQGLQQSAQRRDRFQITLSRSHLTVGMPDYGFTWIDTDLDPPLEWDHGVVQLNHRSYNVEKSCESPTYPQSAEADRTGSISNAYGATYCPPNTWHWGPVSMQPVTPFTIIAANERAVSNASGGKVTFGRPAPAVAYFRGTGNPSPTYVSLDGGATWSLLPTVGPNNDQHPETGNSFWMAVPEGTTSLLLKGNDAGPTKWGVQDMALWAESAPANPARATATPARATDTPAPTATALPATTTALPASPTATLVPSDTPTPQPAAAATPLPCEVAVRIDGVERDWVPC